MKILKNASKSSFSNLIKPIAALTMALSMSVAMGCSDKNKTGESDAAASDATQAIKIATEGAYPPFNATDKDGKLVGFDVDLVNALCDEMKAKCEVVAQDWDGIIPGLKAGKYDAVIAGMSITPERAEQVDFTDSYFKNSLVFVAKKGSTLNPEDKKALEGLTLGTQRATIASQWLEQNLPNTKTKLYDTIGDAFLDLEAGRLDGILSDTAPVVNWLSTGKSDFEIIGNEIDNNDNFGIAVRKQDPLKDKFNKALATVKENGKYDEIKGKYFK
ncbi:transporter substrate-binding domain-containing protein [Psychrobacter sp.]|uniref:transporter substrate-binding domain-containing protein n=1 Tax=Psychrobacter sp. TaxID=56811 RepID=UPI0025CCBEA4|nr:transporter substrate-binding domain-containing protein [Psychrobacter sp.]